MIETLRLDLIRLDGGTQPRAYIDESLVEQYRHALVEQGAEFPPVIVFFDGVDHWLADGFHRWHSHKKAGREEIATDARQGTKRDAILYSLAANTMHGKRRDSTDASRAIRRMLEDPEWREWSDRAIAHHCGASPTSVGHWRALVDQRERARARQAAEAHLSTRGQMEIKENGSASAQPAATRRVKRGGSTYAMKTGPIGKRPKTEAKLATPPSPDPAPPPSDPGKEKLEELAAWLRDGLELLVGLGDEVGGSSNKRGAAIVEFCARHGVSLEPDSRGKYLLSSLLAWSVELHDAEAKRQKATARAIKHTAEVAA